MKAYRQLPYALRYLVALALWPVLLAGKLFICFAIIPFIVPVFIMSGFGFAHRQETVQMNVSIADLLIYGWPRFPRADWQKLFGRRRSRSATHRPIAGKAELLE